MISAMNTACQALLRAGPAVKGLMLGRWLVLCRCVAHCLLNCLDRFPRMQVPTQAYFTEEFGLPLTMNPNFEVRVCLGRKH